MSEPLDNHPHFTRWTDPQSGVVSYILTERVAPYQKGLYYVTPSISRDGRWLWFNAAFGPTPRWELAAVCLDPRQPLIRLFRGVFPNGNPLVRPEGDGAWVPIGGGIYRLSLDRNLEEFCRLPAELRQDRHLFRLCTELTLSADGRWFLLDSHIGNRYLVWLVDARTAEVRPLRWFALPHHHTAFSPTDPELFLISQAPLHDPITGDKVDMNIRIWLMNTKLTLFEPLFPDLWFNRTCKSCHEWWADDGTACWVDYDDGIYETDVTRTPRTRQLVWKHPLCHGQCDAQRRYYCADEDPYHWSEQKPCRVFFYDRQAGREVAIASGLPVPPLPAGDFRAFHTDPHPQFSPDGKYVVYTTTALGRVDVALAPVEAILRKKSDEL